MTRDEKIDYVEKVFYPRGIDRMLVAYSQYYKWKWKKETIEEREKDFRECWMENGYSKEEVEQGILYMQELAKD